MLINVANAALLVISLILITVEMYPVHFLDYNITFLAHAIVSVSTMPAISRYMNAIHSTNNSSYSRK